MKRRYSPAKPSIRFVIAVLLFWPQSLMSWFASVWIGCIAGPRWAALHIDKERSQ
jgi:hypothetical protein